MAEIDDLRELARAFWAGRELLCPRHRGVKLKGSFVQTTYADHIYLECPKGKETISIPQRPRQQEFNLPQVEGLLLSIQRGDNILCFRCQSKLVTDRQEEAFGKASRIIFTCVRCFSYGIWEPGMQSAEVPPAAGSESVKIAE
jgi:hypothetical protein